jgi:hypothetical protein
VYGDNPDDRERPTGVERGNASLLHRYFSSRFMLPG